MKLLLLMSSLWNSKTDNSQMEISTCYPGATIAMSHTTMTSFFNITDRRSKTRECEPLTAKQTVVKTTWFDDWHREFLREPSGDIVLKY